MAKTAKMTIGQYGRLRAANAANDVFALSEIAAEIGGELADDLLKLSFPAFVRKVTALLTSISSIDPEALPACDDHFDLERVTAREMGEFYRAVRVDDFARIVETMSSARVNENATSYLDLGALEFMGALKAFMDAVKKSARG